MNMVVNPLGLDDTANGRRVATRNAPPFSMGGLSPLDKDGVRAYLNYFKTFFGEVAYEVPEWADPSVIGEEASQSFFMRSTPDSFIGVQVSPSQITLHNFDRASEEERATELAQAVALAMEMYGSPLALTGDDNFKLAAWKEAVKQGIAVSGYEPAEDVARAFKEEVKKQAVKPMDLVDLDLGLDAEQPAPVQDVVPVASDPVAARPPMMASVVGEYHKGFLGKLQADIASVAEGPVVFSYDSRMVKYTYTGTGLDAAQLADFNNPLAIENPYARKFAKMRQLTATAHAQFAPFTRVQFAPFTPVVVAEKVTAPSLIDTVAQVAADEPVIVVPTVDAPEVREGGFARLKRGLMQSAARLSGVIKDVKARFLALRGPAEVVLDPVDVKKLERNIKRAVKRAALAEMQRKQKEEIERGRAERAAEFKAERELRRAEAAEIRAEREAGAEQPQRDEAAIAEREAQKEVFAGDRAYAKRHEPKPVKQEPAAKKQTRHQAPTYGAQKPAAKKEAKRPTPIYGAQKPAPKHSRA